MDRLLFLLQMSYYELIGHKRLNVIVIISLALGLLLPFLAFANINVFLKNLDSLKPKIEKNSFYCSVFSTYLSEGKYNELNRELGTIKVGGTSRITQTITIDDEKITDSVTGVSEDFFDFVDMNVVEGRLFDKQEIKEGVKCCIIEETLLSGKNIDKNLGDTIDINGVPFQIIGFVRTVDLSDKIWIPNKVFEKGVAALEQNQYTRYMQYEESESIEIVEKELNYLFEQVLYIQTIREHYTKLLSFCISNSITIFLVTIPIIVFAILNCFMVVYGKIKNGIVNMGIKMVLGSGRKKVFLSCFRDNLFLAVIAYLLDILLLPIVRKTVPSELIMDFDLSVYAAVFILMLIMCFIISLLSVRKVFKINISSVLRGA